jgi:DNA repair ATPase RecN
MSCPCNLCNAREFFQDVHYRDGRYAYEPEVEPEKLTSVYDRLSALADELKAYGAPANFINEVNDLAEKIDTIDDKITKLQRSVDEYKTPRTQAIVDLGEISKELF